MGWKELLQQTPSPSKQSEKAGDLLTFIWSHPLFHPFLHVCMLVASVVSDSLQPGGLVYRVAKNQTQPSMHTFPAPARQALLEDARKRLEILPGCVCVCVCT